MEFFVYGTLTNPDRAAAILSTWTDHGAAVLDGLHRVDGRYPTLAPGGTTEGRILSTPEVDALDEYEGVDSGLYVRVTVPESDGTEVAVYVGDPKRLGAAAEWPGFGPFPERVRSFLDAAELVVRRQ